MPNINAIANQLHHGNNLLDTLGTQFGVPSCALNFAKQLLGSLPSPFLKSLNDSIAEGRRKAQEVMAQITRKLFLDTGIIEFDSRTGRLKFSNNISDALAGQSLLDDINDLGVLGEAIGFAAEAMFIANAIEQQIQDIKNCINQLKNMKGFRNGIKSRRVTAANKMYEAHKHRIENAKAFIDKCDRVQSDIADILYDRANDPENNPEPALNGSFVFPSGDFSGLALSDAFAGGGYAFASGPSVPTVEQRKELFYVTTVLNPPKCKEGQFILHEKGLYYNSVFGGVDVPNYLPDIVVSSAMNNELSWFLNSNPNRGGKGVSVTLEDFNKFANTILDLSLESNIDDSIEMQEFYLSDSFLQNIENQRNKEVSYINNNINTLVLAHGSQSALTISEQEKLVSVVSTYDLKIKKRKRQIQVAAIFGRKRLDNGDVVSLAPGEIPINDFSYMNFSPVKLDYSKQKNLMFNSGDVSGVVLPAVGRFASQENNIGGFLIDHLHVPAIGVGDIITSGTGYNIQSLTDNIETGGLFAIYNFLDTELVPPDSDKYLVTNSIGLDARKNAAQLVSKDIGGVFPSGVGIPYFSGVCKLFGEGHANANYYSATGKQKYYAPWEPASYVRLPDTADFQNLMYLDSGFSIDFWCHLPSLGSESGWRYGTSTSSLHRVILGNENIGGENTVSNINDVGFTRSTGYIRGLLMGFTIDRRITQSLPASNVSSLNPVSNIHFHMSPTLSVNTSSVAFISKARTEESCENNISFAGYDTVGMKIPVSSTTTGSSYKLSDVSGGFNHISITGDTTASGGYGLVSVYLNGELLKQESYLTVFGAYGAPRIPSAKAINSWNYNKVYDGILTKLPQTYSLSSVGWSDFWKWEGPTGSLFTPWILGGGYTDGLMTKQFGVAESSNEGMNFMGEYGGTKSGLGGFLGSVKFYSRPLNIDEVVKNYNAQKGFFSTIKV